jgi:hypothetical protein
VGRIVLPESYLRDGFVRIGGVIKSITPKMLTYVDAGDGRSKTIKLSSVAAICDSPEEAQRLQAFERRVRLKFERVREECRGEYQEFFAKDED